MRARLASPVTAVLSSGATLARGAGAAADVPVSELCRAAGALCPGVQGQLQMWMLLEYCDRGSLEQAIRARRFYKKPSGALDLVRPCSPAFPHTLQRRQQLRPIAAPIIAATAAFSVPTMPPPQTRSLSTSLDALQRSRCSRSSADPGLCCGEFFCCQALCDPQRHPPVLQLAHNLHRGMLQLPHAARACFVALNLAWCVGAARYGSKIRSRTK